MTIPERILTWTFIISGCFVFWMWAISMSVAMPAWTRCDERTAEASHHLVSRTGTNRPAPECSPKPPKKPKE